MFSADDETAHLAETLIFTLNVTIEASPGDRQRIAKAYSSAQHWRPRSRSKLDRRDRGLLPSSSSSKSTRPLRRSRRQVGC